MQELLTQYELVEAMIEIGRIKEKKMNKLIELRKDKPLEDVAEEMMLNPNMYAAYEQEEREPLPEVKKIIANYFGVKVSDIFN